MATSHNTSFSFTTQDHNVNAASKPAGIAPEENSMDDALGNLAHAITRAAQLLNASCDRLGVAEAMPAPSAQTIVSQASDLGSVSNLNMGPLTSLLADDTVNDILVNGPDEVFIERQGMVEKTDIRFSGHEELALLAENIVRAVGRRIDPRRPLVDARLPDGSRVNIVAPPLAVDGISMSIRKFAKEKITLESMIASGNISEQLGGFLKTCAKARVNVIICGGTGSGKTTLLNAISQHIPATDRIVTIEDSAELQLQLPHVVRMETKIPEIHGDAADEVNMRDLVKNALRMRPDRIIVGEVRGPEAFDMIQAMNTGHDGSFTTIHANSARDGLARMENMIGMASLNIPTISIRKQIASAVNFMIQTSRMEDGLRRVTQVAEIVGMEGEIPTMQDIFKFEAKGTGPDGKLQGVHRWTNVFPRHHALTAMLREANILKM